MVQQPVSEQINLRVPVSCRFERTPLREVLANLGRQANLSVQFEDGYSANPTIDLRLENHIQLRSALYLILDPFELSYYVEGRRVMIVEKDIATQLRHLTRRQVSGKSRYCGSW